MARCGGWRDGAPQFRCALFLNAHQGIRWFRHGIQGSDLAVGIAPPPVAGDMTQGNGQLFAQLLLISDRGGGQLGPHPPWIKRVLVLLKLLEWPPLGANKLVELGKTLTLPPIKPPGSPGHTRGR